MEMMRFQSLYFQLKNGTPVFLKKVSVFHKICFEVRVLKSFKISTDCHITPVSEEPILFLSA